MWFVCAQKGKFGFGQIIKEILKKNVKLYLVSERWEEFHRKEWLFRDMQYMCSMLDCLQYWAYTKGLSKNN